MPPKTRTLYVKDHQLWNKASRLAGRQGLSEVVTQSLTKWVADKDKQKAIRSSKELTEVELWVGGKEHQRWHSRDPAVGDYKVVFTGRLLASTEEEYPTGSNPAVEVYQMSNQQLAVYRNYRSELTALLAKSQEEEGATCLIYSDFKNLCRWPGPLETMWDVDHEDEMQMPDVAPYAVKSAKEQAIIGLAGNMQELGKGKDLVKQCLLNPIIDPPKFTEGDIDYLYEEVKRDACDLRFQKSIAEALGAELVIRVDRSLSLYRTEGP